MSGVRSLSYHDTLPCWYLTCVGLSCCSRWGVSVVITHVKFHFKCRSCFKAQLCDKCQRARLLQTNEVVFGCWRLNLTEAFVWPVQKVGNECLVALFVYFVFSGDVIMCLCECFMCKQEWETEPALHSPPSFSVSLIFQFFIFLSYFHIYFCLVCDLLSAHVTVGSDVCN